MAKDTVSKVKGCLLQGQSAYSRVRVHVQGTCSDPGPSLTHSLTLALEIRPGNERKDNQCSSSFAHVPNCGRETRLAPMSSKHLYFLTTSQGTISGLGKAQGRRVWGEFSRPPVCQDRVGLPIHLRVPVSYSLTVNASLFLSALGSLALL